MSLNINDRTALVVIDVQQGFEDAAWWGPRNNPDCEANIELLLAEWRNGQRPIVFVQHSSTNPLSPLHPSNPGHALKVFVSGEPDLLVDKSVNSSFHGTPDLHDWLQSNTISSLVICGITTNHCCETTARVAGNLGYQVFFALDATHTFDRKDVDGGNVHAAELSRITGVNLHEEFATVVNTQSLLANRTSRTR
ncbi:cysteine hydrolase family protein [Mycetocola zhadangensis]|uniref:Cysteine hydrolase n=1 Tax=Mycetocola zhadangensis TaxID=1164595 RepID=A0A3L7J5R8_9MICO|nr:cysteine hydrolase family protein [Mycetocola zhadangensis]RLQ85966.1 cysteine hydrolase [Mycetocola zhadangensis]GGE87274.1 isochorismatase [Mycetocola zhadangensis]